MQLQSQVFATNTLAQHVVLCSDPTGRDLVEWYAAGDPSGNDVQVVPASVQATPGFQKLLNRGIIAITDDFNAPEVVEAFNRQRTAWEARGSAASASAQASLLREQANDLVQVYCVGPDARGAEGKCGTPVPVRESSINDKPTLCAQHQGLAHQFVPVEKEMTPGVPESKQIVWSRMATTAPVREIAVG